MINIYLRSNYKPRFKIMENFQCGEYKNMQHSKKFVKKENLEDR